MSVIGRVALLGSVVAGAVTLAACTAASPETGAAGVSIAPTSEPASAGSRGVIADCAMADPLDQVIEVDSAVFAGTDRVSVHFTPCTVDQPLPVPVVYLLHGAGADETQWPDVGIFAAADAAVAEGSMPPSVLVAPDAAAAYSCRDCADDLVAHLIDEIEPAIDRIAPVDASRRAIGGISRGGGLALEAAGAAPEEFVAVGAHSSVTAPDTALAAIAAADLPVRFDAGVSDSLTPRDQKMATYVETHGGTSEFHDGVGRHDRDYWRSQADAYVDFYAAHLH